MPYPPPIETCVPKPLNFQKREVLWRLERRCSLKRLKRHQTASKRVPNAAPLKVFGQGSNVNTPTFSARLAAPSLNCSKSSRWANRARLPNDLGFSESELFRFRSRTIFCFRKKPHKQSLWHREFDETTKKAPWARKRLVSQLFTDNDLGNSLAPRNKGFSTYFFFNLFV